MTCDARLAKGDLPINGQEVLFDIYTGTDAVSSSVVRKPCFSLGCGHGIRECFHCQVAAVVPYLAD